MKATDRAGSDEDKETGLENGTTVQLHMFINAHIIAHIIAHIYHNGT